MDADRLDHLHRFYNLLELFEDRLCGNQTLALGRHGITWPRHGIYLFFEDGKVRAALDRLRQAANSHKSALVSFNAMSARDVQRRWPDLVGVNKMPYQAERMLTDPAGLDGREWYKHLNHAPGFYTAYGFKTMAGICEAVEDQPDVAVAQREAARLADAIDRYASQVNRAAPALQQVLN